MQQVNVPGKVLLFGGYSVLLRGHVSLSIAVVDSEGKGILAEPIEDRRVVSRLYGIDSEPDQNSLIGLAYLCTEKYLESVGRRVEVGVRLWTSPVFGSPEEKSGLGGSAAATVAVVSSLFQSAGFDPFAHVETIHKISQYAHALFQGKVGSGFDVATSAFGRTIVYKRYDPSVIDLSSGVAGVLKAVAKPWPWLEVRPFTWPSEYSLLVFNIPGATSTVSAVKAWKKWKAKEPEAFQALMARQDEVEKKAIEALERGDDRALRHWTREARAVHREMQERIARLVPEAEPVEPPEFTSWIDAAEGKDLAVAGRCPGAGGRDSVAFITRRADPGALLELARDLGVRAKFLPTRVR